MCNVLKSVDDCAVATACFRAKNILQDVFCGLLTLPGEYAYFGM